MLNTNFNIQLTSIILLLALFGGCGSKPDSSTITLADKWISVSSPVCEIWFQNWGDYQRLLLVVDSDSMIVEPNPYYTEDVDKPYLKPRSYTIVEKIQLKGNLLWDEVPVWDDGIAYSCTWEVDRANPKILLPQTYYLDMIMIDGNLKLNIKNQEYPFLAKVFKKITEY